jgi:hypothetical protein
LKSQYEQTVQKKEIEKLKWARAQLAVKRLANFKNKYLANIFLHLIPDSFL